MLIKWICPIVLELNSSQTWQSLDYTLDLFHGELTREKHISSYQSNRKWGVSSSTPNQDRSCSEMCLGIVPISLFPSRFFSSSLGQAGAELAIMMVPSPAPRLMGRKVWPLFRHLSQLLGFNMAGVSCSWRGEACWGEWERAAQGTQVGGKDKQTQREIQHACEQKN